MMNIGVTGANGFIGKLLVEKFLGLGYQVHVLSRKKVNLDKRVITHFGDLLDLNSLNSFVMNVDVLYHCAAEIKDESKMKVINVEGTHNLIVAASNKIKHWVQLSSVGVYGPVSTGLITEAQPYNPINVYEKTKLEADLLVLEAFKKKSFTYTLIRPSIVFGVNMTNQSLFDLIKIVDKGFYFFMGKEGASANYVTVEDVIETLYLAGTHPKAENQIYNISNWTSIEDFIGLISRKLFKPAPKLRLPLRPIYFLAKVTSFIPRNPLTKTRINALNNRSIYSIEKIKSELNFESKFSIEDGIDGLIKKYKSR